LTLALADSGELLLPVLLIPKAWSSLKMKWHTFTAMSQYPENYSRQNSQQFTR